jgi:arginine decarboxylase
MPGHKLGRGIPGEFLKDLLYLDVTEIPGTDNLHFPEGAIREALELAAKAYGADETFFLVNGSTCGVHAAIMTICKPGDKLIVGRDCHKSVINGMMLAGVEPVFAVPEYDSRFSITTFITPREIENILRNNSDCAGVFITRPNYYGICSDVQEIAAITHRYNKILAVDEAHGAHLGFNSRYPERALSLGADISIQSAHKTLPAVTQGAYLHVKSQRVDTDRLKYSLSILQTSSPSYIIMSFLDIARAIMEVKGQKLLDALLDNIGWLKCNVENKGLLMLSEYMADKCITDNSRIVINVAGLRRTGFEVEKILRKENNIQVEMSDMSNIVCISTVADNREGFERLCNALNGLSPGDNGSAFPVDKCNTEIFAAAKPVMSLKDVLHSRGRKIEIHQAPGKVCRGMVTPYPPGIPVICPGEVIQEAVVDYIIKIIAAGGKVNGLGDNMDIEVVV